MVVKEDQERVKTLISDTITLLCRNGLTFKSKFNINALIGITLDEDDVFLLDIRETIKNNVPVLEEDSAAESDSVERDTATPQTRKRKKRKRSSSGQRAQSDFDSDAESNSQSVADNSRTIKTEQDDDDDNDLVFIKDEPADPSHSLQNQNMFSNNSFYQNSQSQQQSGDILGSLAQQGQLYATPATSDSLSAPPSQWDPSTSQVPFSQSTPSSVAVTANQLNLSGASSIGDSPSQPLRSSVRGYRCTTCLRTLSCSSALYRHIRNAHLGVFTHRCSICGQGFSNQPGLQGHLVQTHGHTQLKRACKVCGKEYAREDTLQRHMKYAHGGSSGGSEASGETAASQSTSTEGAGTLHSNAVSAQQDVQQQQYASETQSATQTTASEIS